MFVCEGVLLMPPYLSLQVSIAVFNELFQQAYKNNIRRNAVTDQLVKPPTNLNMGLLRSCTGLVPVIKTWRQKNVYQELGILVPREVYADFVPLQ